MSLEDVYPETVHKIESSAGFSAMNIIKKDPKLGLWF